MGVYVQQDIFTVKVEFSGIWATSHFGELTVCKQDKILFITFPDVIFPQTTPGNIVALLPENLWPTSQTLLISGGQDNGSIITTIFVNADGTISVGTPSYSGVPTMPFQGVGLGGFSSSTIAYLTSSL